MGMNARDGKALTGRDHIRQSVMDILTTPIGSLLMRRTYGSLLPELIDQPINPATLLRVKSAAATALIQWEPRITLQKINLSVDNASITAEIEAIESDGVQLSLTVPLGLKGVLA